MGRTLNNSAVAHRVLRNQSPEFVQDLDATCHRNRQHSALKSRPISRAHPSCLDTGCACPLFLITASARGAGRPPSPPPPPRPSARPRSSWRSTRPVCVLVSVSSYPCGALVPSCLCLRVRPRVWTAAPARSLHATRPRGLTLSQLAARGPRHENTGHRRPPFSSCRCRSHAL